MSIIIGNFKEYYQVTNVSDIQICRNMGCFSGLIIDSEIPIMSKSGLCCIWKFNLMDQTGIVNCRMFFRPEDKELVMLLENREAIIQCNLFTMPEGIQVNVIGMKVL